MSEVESKRMTPVPGNEGHRHTVGSGVPVDFDLCKQTVHDFVSDPDDVRTEELVETFYDDDQAIYAAVEKEAEYQELNSEFDRQGYEIGMVLMRRAIKLQRRRDSKPSIRLTDDAVKELRFVKLSNTIYSDNADTLFSVQQQEFIRALAPYLRPGGLNNAQANSFWRGAIDYNFMVNSAIKSEIASTMRAWNADRKSKRG